MPRPKAPHTYATGWARASQGDIGLLHPAVPEMLTDFKHLNTEAARAAFARRWIALVSGRLEETWPTLYELLRIVREQELYKKPQASDTSYDSFAAYFEAEVKQPFTTWHDLEETYHYVTTYAPELLSRPFAEAKLGVQVHDRTHQASTDPEVGRVLPNDGSVNQHNMEEGVQIEHPQKQRAKSSGISRTTQNHLDWLARKAPEHLERVQRGEISVHRACIQAGHIKEVTPLQACIRAWNRMSLDQRAVFLAFIDHEAQHAA